MHQLLTPARPGRPRARRLPLARAGGGRLCRRAALLALVGGLLAPRARAQDERELPVTVGKQRWGAAAEFSAVEGDTVTLRVHVVAAAGWHVYALEGDAGPEEFPTAFELEALPAGLVVPPGAAWSGPEPQDYLASGIPTKVYSGRTVFEFPLKVEEFAAGKLPVRGKVRAMACNDKMCMPPGEADFEATLAVEGAPDAGPEIPADRQWGAAGRFSAKAVPPGSVVQLLVTVETGSGWHVYGLEEDAPEQFFTRFELEDLPAGLRVPEGATFRGPEPEELDLFGEKVKAYEGRNVFELPVHVSEEAGSGTLVVEGSVQALACNDRLCLQTATVPFRAELVVDPQAPPAATATVGTAAPAAPTQSKGLLALALFCLGGAVVSWVMPCVYPMIPITISFFGKMAEQKHSGRVGIAVSYGIGIAGTFILTGLVVGLLALGVADASERSGLASLGNDLATNPWVNLVIGLVFVVFALSMFGLFEFRVPNWLINKADAAGRSSRSTHVGSILLGITFALASFTCTVPVVGFLLGTAASGTGEGLFRSLYGMSIYGAAFAAPFVALSLFPGALASLPRAGGWMETVKVGFGFIELAAAVKFLWVPDIEWSWGVLSRPVVLALFLLVGVGACAFFLGLVPLGHGAKSRPFRVGVGRWVTVGATLALLVPVTAYLTSPPRYQAPKLPLPDSMASLMEALLPPPPSEDDLARSDGWYVDDYAGALEEARRKDRPLFIDFTGVYCANCRAMERNVFPRPEVAELLEQMVRTRLYVDRKEPKHKEFKDMQVERYGLSSQPYYVLLDPRDEAPLAQAGGWIPGEFQELLEEGLAKFRERRKGDVARADG